MGPWQLPIQGPSGNVMTKIARWKAKVACNVSAGLRHRRTSSIHHWEFDSAMWSNLEACRCAELGMFTVFKMWWCAVASLCIFARYVLKWCWSPSQNLIALLGLALWKNKSSWSDFQWGFSWGIRLTPRRIWADGKAGGMLMGRAELVKLVKCAGEGGVRAGR